MLGFIPDFQFSPNPRVNPLINSHVSMPSGEYQAGVYYTQPAYPGWGPKVAPPRRGDTDHLVQSRVARSIAGLGYVMASNVPKVAGLGAAEILPVPPVVNAALEGVTDFIADYKWPLMVATAAAAAYAVYRGGRRR